VDLNPSIHRCVLRPVVEAGFRVAAGDLIA